MKEPLNYSNYSNYSTKSRPGFLVGLHQVGFLLWLCDYALILAFAGVCL